MSDWRVLHGDCFAELRAMVERGERVDHVITDPPYSDAVHGKQWVSAALTEDGDKRASSQHRAIDFDAITETQMRDTALWAARLRARWLLGFTDVESAHLWRAAIEAAELDYVRTCFWDKVDSSPQFTGDRPASAVEAIVVAHPPGRKKWNGGGQTQPVSPRGQRREGRQATPHHQAAAADVGTRRAIY